MYREFAPIVRAVTIIRKGTDAPTNLEVTANKPRTKGGALMRVSGLNFVGASSGDVDAMHASSRFLTCELGDCAASVYPLVNITATAQKDDMAGHFRIFVGDE